MTDPAYAAQPEQRAPYAPPRRRSSSTSMLMVTGGLTAAFAAGAFALGANPSCHEVPRPPTDTHVCDNHYYETSRASCRDRLRVSEAKYPPLTECITSPLVPALGVGAGVTGLVFLGLAGSAVVRRRDTIAASAANAYRSYQAAAPQRAEAAQRARENLGRYATAAATVASNVGDMYREHRANRDVPPSTSYPDDVQDYPDFEPDTHTDPVPPTVTDTAAAASADDGNSGGWGF